VSASFFLGYNKQAMNDFDWQTALAIDGYAILENAVANLPASRAPSFHEKEHDCHVKFIGLYEWQ
jgi:hypothetical protein